MITNFQNQTFTILPIFRYLKFPAYNSAGTNPAAQTGNQLGHSFGALEPIRYQPYLQLVFIKTDIYYFSDGVQVKLLACLHMVVFQVAAIQIDVDTNEPISYQPTARPLRPPGPGLGPRASPSPTYPSSDASKSYSHTFVGEFMPSFFLEVAGRILLQ